MEFLLAILGLWMAIRAERYKHKANLLEIDSKIYKDKAFLLDAYKESMKDKNFFTDIYHASFSFVLNMNDTFNYASCDCVNIDSDHVEELRELYEKHGYDIFVAYASIKGNRKPIPPIAERQSYIDSLSDLKNHPIYEDIKHD